LTKLERTFVENEFWWWSSKTNSDIPTKRKEMLGDWGEDGAEVQNLRNRWTQMIILTSIMVTLYVIYITAARCLQNNI
jgi:hypothetical protein